MKDTKALLKEARELIKNKDYETALKICKNILKLDKENYMGLIFFGLSAQESGVSLDQALAAFKKATKLNPDNILAWNGLMNYYEKLDTQKDEKRNQTIDDDIIEVYIKVLQLETNENKVLETFEKLLNHSKVNVSKNIIDTLFIAIDQETYSDSTRVTMKEKLANYFAKQNLNELDTYLSQKYEDLLRILINNTKTKKLCYYLDYLNILYRNNNTEELFNASEVMYETYQNKIALEWSCKIYNEFIIEKRTLPTCVNESKIQEYCDILLTESDNVSTMAKFSKAVILFNNNNNVLESRNLLMDVLESRPGLLHSWYLLSRCYDELEMYSKALESLNKADKLLKSINDSNKNLRYLIDEMQSKVLSRQEDVELLNVSEEKTKLLLETNSNCVDLTRNLIMVYINKMDYNEATKLMDKLRNANEDVTFLEVEMLIKQEKLRDALDKLLILNLIDNYEYFKLIGILHWRLEEYEKALIPLLKAVKCKPYSYVCFLYLGHYYKMFKNGEKSRRCYEKAFNINMDCIEAGIELTNIYRNYKNWDANLNLLESVTTGKLNSKNEWAYLQLGLHYLEQENYSKAIDSLRYVVRAHPQNSHFWEALGDAYLARGSYTSALKSYNQCAELCENNLYSLLQIANIKFLLQDYVDARKDFEQILLLNAKYLPALKGLAETCLKQGEIYQKNQLFGLARDCTQNALDNITIALRERPNISCLWKIAGDSCFLTTKLPDRYCFLIASIALTDNTDVDGRKALERENLFELATRCYCRALTLIDDNILLWHDLGVCYLSHARFTESEQIKGDLYEKALACAKYCIEKNPQNWTHWNLLGNISFFKEPKNYALAQHAFIKSIMLEHNNAVAWCNLGTLYLHLDNVQLANKAFSQAQRADPNYVNCWIGQALIAEIMGHEDAMDLFRHSTQLAVHPESSIGYGHWVCKTLVENPPNKIIYAIHNMYAVTVAHDAMSWYAENNQDDACGWNIYGILSERLGLKNTASVAFKKASLFCDNNHRDNAYVNYGRILMKLEKYKDSLNTYRNVKEANFNSGIGLALSLFKDQQYEESYNAYEAAYDWLTDDQVHQSDLLVALASMALLFQKHDDAKQLLLKSTSLKPPSPYALYATLSFALLYNDPTLAVLVLKELKSLEGDTNCLEHYATLLSHFYLVQGDGKKALLELSKLVHKYPDQASVWYQLSILILRLRDVKRYPVASKCAQITMILGRNTMDVTKVLCLVSLVCFMANDHKKALIYAQKAVHCYPNIAETWTVFMCSLYSIGANNASKNVGNFIKNHMRPSNLLNDWLIDKC